MPEHPIALRRAWELQRPDTPPERIDLPGTLPPTIAPLRLVRSFNRPRFDPEAETLALRLADVPGLAAVRLNGTPLTPATDSLSIDPARLARRNLLELVVAPADHPRPAWGAVALVLAPRADRLAT